MAISTTSGDRVEITIEDEEQIAKGDWATVYRAKIMPNGDRIAIKQVKETKQYKVDTHLEQPLKMSIENWRSCVR